MTDEHQVGIRGVFGVEKKMQEIRAALAAQEPRGLETSC